MTSKDFLSQILSITFIFLSSFLRKSQYFPFWMFSAKQGHYWYHLWYDAVLDWGLNSGPPALKASTIPLGYRGGGMGQLKDPFLLQFPSFQIQTQLSRFNTDNLMSRSIYLTIDFIQLALVLALNGKHGNKSASKVCVERDTKKHRKKPKAKLYLSWFCSQVFAIIILTAVYLFSNDVCILMNVWTFAKQLIF